MATNGVTYALSQGHKDVSRALLGWRDMVAVC